MIVGSRRAVIVLFIGGVVLAAMSDMILIDYAGGGFGIEREARSRDGAN